MLTPRLTNCQECANIPNLIDKIDCKLAEIGSSMYNNVVFMLNYPIPATLMLQLIAYRRILIFKYCNPNYVKKYSIDLESKFFEEKFPMEQNVSQCSSINYVPCKDTLHCQP